MRYAQALCLPRASRIGGLSAHDSVRAPAREARSQLLSMQADFIVPDGRHVRTEAQLIGDFGSYPLNLAFGVEQVLPGEFWTVFARRESGASPEADEQSAPGGGNPPIS